MERRILAFCLVLLSFGCTKEEKGEINVRILAHGGNGFYSEVNPFPPNSLPAIQKGYGNSILDGIEVDMRCTKDSVMVLYHDENLLYYTGVNASVASLTWDELQTIRYQKPRKDYAPICSVHEMLKWVEDKPQKEIRIQIQNEEDYCIRTLLKHHFPANVSFAINNWSLFDTLRSRLENDVWLTHNEVNLALKHFQGNYPERMEIAASTISELAVSQLMDMGIEVSLYDMNGMEEYFRIRDWSMAEVQVDNVTHAFLGLSENN